MQLNQEQIDKLAQLAKLELSAPEKKSLETELSDILDFVEKLKEVDTANVLETSQVTDLTNVMRLDKANYNFNRDEMLATMPKVENGYLKIPAVFTKDSPSH